MRRVALFAALAVVPIVAQSQRSQSAPAGGRTVDTNTVVLQATRAADPTAHRRLGFFL